MVSQEIRAKENSKKYLNSLVERMLPSVTSLTHKDIRISSKRICPSNCKHTGPLRPLPSINPCKNPFSLGLDSTWPEKQLAQHARNVLILDGSTAVSHVMQTISTAC